MRGPQLASWLSLASYLVIVIVTVRYRYRYRWLSLGERWLSFEIRAKTWVGCSSSMWAKFSWLYLAFSLSIATPFPMIPHKLKITLWLIIDIPAGMFPVLSLKRGGNLAPTLCYESTKYKYNKL